MVCRSTIKDRTRSTAPCLPFQPDLVPVPRQLYANRSVAMLQIEERAVSPDQLKIGRREPRSS